MKKKHLLGVLSVALCLMGCSNEDEKEVDNLLSELDEGITISNQGQGDNYYNDIYKYGESENAFYYVYRQQMYYFDKNKNNIMLMCTKPECDHIIYKDNQRVYYCEALYADNCFVQVYDGKLYADAETGREEPQSIIVSNLDGTDKKVAVKNIEERIEKESDRFNSGGIVSYVSSLTWRIYDDILYVFTNMSGYGGENNYFFIDKYDLKSGEYLGEVTNKILEGNQGNVIEVYKYGDKMLINITIARGRNEKIYDMCIEVELTNGDINIIEIPETISETLYNGKVIFQTDYENVCMMDSSGQTETCIELNEYERNRGVVVTRIGEYLFVTPLAYTSSNDSEYEYYTKVYDQEFKLVDMIELPENVLPRGGYNCILLRKRASEEYYSIDASQIGTGNVEVKEYTVK
ncbi:MAG: hypothetical protein IJP13_04620 [Lachnospiraceae bacterium]|nr:hypothetical protein [Lachnospiraceae bacterium]